MRSKGDPRTREEMNKVKDWLSKEDPVTIATHQKVDADAAFSAALLQILRPQAELEFVRADAEITDEGYLAVDLCEGPRAVKGLEKGSAFGLIITTMKEIDRPVYNALRRWANQLNLTDSGKNCNDSVVLAGLVNCWRSLKFNDAKIVSRAKELVQGKIRSEKRNQELWASAKSISIDNGIAVVPEEIQVRASHLFKRGALVVIRQSKSGQSVNISKQLQKNDILLTELSTILPEEWFVHPQGFMACFGSVKAPKDFKESGLKLEELIIVVKTWIKSQNETLSNEV